LPGASARQSEAKLKIAITAKALATWDIIPVLAKPFSVGELGSALLSGMGSGALFPSAERQHP